MQISLANSRNLLPSGARALGTSWDTENEEILALCQQFCLVPCPEWGIGPGKSQQFYWSLNSQTGALVCSKNSGTDLL